MTQWSKQTLEKHYESDLTDKDCRIINEELDGMTWDNVDEDTRLFKDINKYVSYVYDTYDVISNFFEFMTYLATEETESVYTAKELLLDDEAVELDKGKILLVME
ncbi:hypothetical protein NGH46_13720 [Staphylococcus xylosus]|uniref:hypothetical protein n=1 Tax=Staphylococcus xylosus TaxID=1288 RepID=UPI002DB99A48|nr:hypothetical protein [Staphylococcus xylosus]MEB8123169.1 hypothetical protein [Staphylococcus xylosus]